MWRYLSKIVFVTGVLLLILGIGVICGYASYSYVTKFMTNDDIPLIIRFAGIFVPLGMIILLLSVIVDRIKSKERTYLKDLDS